MLKLYQLSPTDDILIPPDRFYSFNPATPSNGVITVAPFTITTYTPIANASVSIAVGSLPTGISDRARDCCLIIDCRNLSAGQAPTIAWPQNFHPRTIAATDFVCTAGKRNIYFISEFGSETLNGSTVGSFAVGGWQETTGGGSSAS